MFWVATKFLPRLLSEEQKENRVNMCQFIQVNLEGDPEFLSKEMGLGFTDTTQT
jgi:hypothetical protein